MTARQPGNGDGLYLRLEVPPGASHDEVARAYRRLAHDAHPDAHPGDADATRRFREITEAYEVLGNPDQARAIRPSPQAGSAWALTGPLTGLLGHSTRPAPTRFASPTLTGGPPVFLGAEPVTDPSSQLSVGPVHVRLSTLGATAVVYARRGRSGLIGAVALRRVRAEVALTDGVA